MNALKKLAILSIVAWAGLLAVDADAKAHKDKAAKHPAVAEKKVADEDFSTPHKGEKPLMVIRFNQPEVAYEWPMYETLTKALESKPQARFDVVSVAPRMTDPVKQKESNTIANDDVEKVLSTLKEIGMPETRYDVTKVYDDVATSEVRVFVYAD